MSALNSLKERIPDFARDARLNLGTVLTPEGAPGLSEPQILGIALASAYATRSRSVISALEAETESALPAEAREAARASAAIMAMNNVYYRFLHLAEDREFRGMPAKLRMNVIGRPGIPKVDFELYCLAVSALAGCGMCINAHVAEVKKAGISNEGVQSAVRIAAVINSAAQAVHTAGES